MITRKSKIIFSAITLLVLAGAIGVGAYHVFAVATNQAGVGYGAIGMDSSFNVSVGSSSPAGIARFVVNASSGASTYTLKALSSTGASLFSVDNSGNVVTAGSLTAGSFVGNLSGTVTAGNISSGAFGANTGGGIYSFPSNIGISGDTTPAQTGLLSLGYSVTNGYAWIQSFNSKPLTLNPVGNNVGIGTTNPTTALAVVGNVSSTGLCLSGVCNTTWPTSGVSSIFGRTGAVTAASGDYTVAQVTGAAPLASPTFTGSVTIVNGSLGVGMSSVPNGQMSIAGSNTTGVGPALWLYNTTGASNVGAAAEIAFSTDGSTDNTPNASIMVVQNGISGGSADTVFDNWNGGTNVETMRIRSNGNVGIGTTAPAQKLSVAGTIQSTSGGIMFPDGTTQTTAASGSSVVGAGNVSAGTFGANTGGGNYSFSGNILPSMASNSGGGAWYLGSSAWGGTIGGAGSVTGLTYSGGLGSQLFTLSSGPGQASLQLDGSVFIGDGLTSAPFGFDSTSDGYLAVQNSAGIGGNLTVNGNITAGYSNGGYSISANMIGVQTSLYSYGMICAGNNSGSCNSINGVVIAGSGSNTYGNVYLTGSGNSYFNGGNVGIGTSGPVQKLSVAGEITANEGTWGSGGYSFIQDGSQDTGMFSPSDGVIDFYDNQVHSINISAAGNATFYAGPYTNDWFRVNGSGGIVWQSYGGGWYMQDTTWIRSYGSKPVYMSNGFDSGAASGVNCGGGLGNGYTFDVCGTANVASNLTVAGNLSVSNKITATTFDPVYTIGGTNYATYLPGMTGVKEETAGTLDLQRNSDGSYSFTINFASEPTGGDLWLFAKATDMPGAMSQLVVSLTPSFSGNVWYEKNAALGTLTIHGSAAGEVSYNLTAPRFDASQWTNIGDPNAKGLLVK